MFFNKSKEDLIIILKKYEKYLDLLYLILYILIFIDAILLASGFQNNLLMTIPEWETSYLISNIMIAFLSAGAITLILIQRRKAAYIYSGLLITFFAIWTFLEAYMLLFHLNNNEILFRMSFNLFITIMLVFRNKFIELSLGRI